MKTIFKKSHLPFLKPALHGGTGRDLWTVARYMQDENGLQHQLSAELMLLQRGVQMGDEWAMCELARTYFHHCGDLFLPMALRFWKQAALKKDAGAMDDLKRLPIRERILSYKSFDGNGYKEIEMKCALLTEWYLTKLGTSPWEAIDTKERTERCTALIKEACTVLQIPYVEAAFVHGLTFKDRIVDGLAHWEGKITLREEVLLDFERLIEVIFHELGHIVAFQMLKGNERLKKLYGITEERIGSWERKEMGYDALTSEEDPDTLSYGVYTLWASFFADCKGLTII